jgi:hypothetical protein
MFGEIIGNQIYKTLLSRLHGLKKELSTIF